MRKDKRLSYVYEHWRPDKNECFYVGKGTDKRAYDFDRRTKHHKNVCTLLAREGMCAEVRLVASELTGDEAISFEIERIAYWRDQGIDLVNKTIGGDGLVGLIFTAEHKANISAAKKGKKLTEKHKKKIAEGLAKAKLEGRPAGIRRGSGLRWHHSNEAKAKIAAATKGNTRGSANKGRIRTEAFKEKVRTGLFQYYQTHDGPMKGQSMSDAQKEKIRKSLIRPRITTV